MVFGGSLLRVQVRSFCGAATGRLLLAGSLDPRCLDNCLDRTHEVQNNSSSKQIKPSIGSLSRRAPGRANLRCGSLN